MSLKYDNAWRFDPPSGEIPEEAVENFYELMLKVVGQSPNKDAASSRKDRLEEIKGFFSNALGEPHSPSSSTSWAEGDLKYLMKQAGKNVPAFIETVYDTFQRLKKRGYSPPDVAVINRLLKRHDVGFEIIPPNLVSTLEIPESVEIPDVPSSLSSKAADVFRESRMRADELLSEGRGEEAIRELLWLLESVTTAFRGVEAGKKEIKGKYFNEIARDLKHAELGSTFTSIIQWMLQLHGWLSAPTGGGVRHGRDLEMDPLISDDEARLICNLIRSYLGFILSAHSRLVDENGN